GGHLAGPAGADLAPHTFGIDGFRRIVGRPEGPVLARSIAGAGPLTGRTDRPVLRERRRYPAGLRSLPSEGRPLVARGSPGRRAAARALAGRPLGNRQSGRIACAANPSAGRFRESQGRWRRKTSPMWGGGASRMEGFRLRRYNPGGE